GDPMDVAVDKLRIAYFVDNGILRPDTDTEATVRRAAQALGARECRPPRIERTFELEMKYLAPDGGDGLRGVLRAIGSSETLPLRDGCVCNHEPYRTSAEGFAAYWAELDAFRAGMHAFLNDYDAVVSPVAAFAAVPHGKSINGDVFPGFSYTMTYNMTGWPAA